MKTGTKFYQFTGKKLLGLMDDYWKDRGKMTSEGRKFSKKVGGHSKDFYVIYDDRGTRMSSVIFTKLPDQKLWKTEPSWNNGKRAFSGVPKRNTKKGKALYEEFKSVTRPSFKPIKEAINWKDVFYSDGRGQFLSAFSIFHKEKFCGFTVPEIDGEIPKELNLRGCKEIKYSTYAKHLED